MVLGVPPSMTYEKLAEVFQKLVPESTLQVPHQEHVPSSVILEKGELFKEPSITYTAMESQACHDNVMFLYRRYKIKNMCIGYALANDLKWRYHSWGLGHTNSIVETTTPFLLYFGCVMVK